ncbi:MAG: hypothetical protein ABW224_08485 [Kibdelosporangium sp.]
MRINAISPGWVRETLLALGGSPEDGTPVVDVAQTYVDAVEDSTINGRTLIPS